MQKIDLPLVLITQIRFFYCRYYVYYISVFVYFLYERNQIKFSLTKVYCSHKTATNFLEDKQELSDFKFNVATRVTAEVFRALKIGKLNAAGEKFQ